MCTQRGDRLVKMLSGSTFDLDELGDPRFIGAKKVGTHKRSSGGKDYQSPKIILDKYYMDFIGKKYRPYRGRATLVHEGHESIDSWSQEGECIVLFFPEGWNAPDPEPELFPEG